MTYLKPALLVLFLAACLSLAVLSVWSFADLIRGNFPSTDTATVEVEAAKALAEKTRQRAETDLPVVQELAKTDLLDPLAVEPGARTSAAVKVAAESWQQSVAARDFVTRVAALPWTPAAAPATGEDRKKDAEARRDRFQKFLDDEKKKGVAGDKVIEADRVLGMIGDRVAQIEAELKESESLSQFQAKFNEVTERYSKKENNHGTSADPDLHIQMYEECLADLDGIAGNDALLSGIHDPQLAVLAAKEKGKRDGFRRGIQYNRDWWALEKRYTSERQPGYPVLLRAFREFLAQYPTPPSPSDRQTHVWVVERKSKLEVQDHIAKLNQAADLKALLDQAESIATNQYASDKDKDEVRVIVTNWLETREFPPLKTPRDPSPSESLEEKQEAVVMDKTKGEAREERLIGFFQKAQGGTQWWQFSPRHSTADQAGDKREVCENPTESPYFVDKPGTPLYVQLADNYNRQLKALLGDVASRDQWETFAQKCEQLGKQFTEYQTRWKQDENGLDRAVADQWNFPREAQKARQVLKQWKQFQTVMGK
ncbi:MAG: hypothetical protein ACYC35_04970 [Pirellulales bacterium]